MSGTLLIGPFDQQDTVPLRGNYAGSPHGPSWKDDDEDLACTHPQGPIIPVSGGNDCFVDPDSTNNIAELLKTGFKNDE